MKLKKENGKWGWLLKSIVGLILVNILAWGIWITDGRYSHSADIAQAKQENKTLCDRVDGVENGLKENINDLKIDVKVLKEELKDQANKIDEKQDRMLRLLIQIERKK